MSHFYEILNNGNVIFRDDISSAAQARSAEGAIVASVTTKMKIMSNDFLDRWKLKKVFDLSRENPSKSFDEVSDMMWGSRKLPCGNTVCSADFGTAIHKQIEIECNYYRDHGCYYEDTEMDMYVKPFIKWVKDNEIEIYETELIIGCDAHQTAGTIDLLAKRNNKFELFDYKTRECRGNIKTKAYQKDAMQLAVEAAIIKFKFELSYMPRINTVLIDSDSGETYVKKWTKNAQEKAYNVFKRCSELYDSIESLG